MNTTAKDFEGGRDLGVTASSSGQFTEEANGRFIHDWTGGCVVSKTCGLKARVHA
jgi:precorrin-6x reductase